MFEALVAEVGEYAKAVVGGEAMVGFGEAGVCGGRGGDGQCWVEVFSLEAWNRHW